MDRKETATKARPTAAEPGADGTVPAESSRQPAPEAAKPPAFAPDPRPMISVSLSHHRGGPAMHLLRSHRFRQMQIRFDGEQPAGRHLARLKEAGWRDRTEEEGIWTKQIDRDARWQSVQRMERQFREVANAIREEKGLGPALTGMGPA